MGTLIFIFSVLIASISQLLLKKGSAKKEKNLYFNKYTIGGYLLLFTSTLLTVYAYRTLNLSIGMMLESLSYIFVPMLSVVILKEKLSKRILLGMLIIVLGVVLYSI